MAGVNVYRERRGLFMYTYVFKVQVGRVGGWLIHEMYIRTSC
jgi:hypothetical protein